MRELHIKGKTQDSIVYFQTQALRELATYLPAARQRFLITDESVDALYGDQVMKEAGCEAKIVLPSGEAYKSLLSAQEILMALAERGARRSCQILALGGGVVGDLAGFCASIYLRGVSLVHIPTTLLAQVDSSVGGKTAVNLPQGKNLVGSFWQPAAVWIDPAFLRSLPDSQITSGLGEIVKYGAIGGEAFLAQIEQSLKAVRAKDSAVLLPLIERCCALKANIVEADERESGLRKVLNFGHTLGHALEALGGYRRYSHGEAVLAGMHGEARLAAKKGALSQTQMRRLIQVIEQVYPQPDYERWEPEELVRYMQTDKKNQDEQISFVVPQGEMRFEELRVDKDSLLVHLREMRALS